MRTAHILPLTGVRFLAAAWVVLFHFGGTFIVLCPLLRPLQHFFSLGYYAVPFFFLLSGFILSHNYFASYTIKDHPKFIFYRFARLWPVHVAAFLLAFSYSGYSLGEHPVSFSVQELSMVRSWFSPDLTVNYPAWSISAEWFAYICIFPFAFLILSRIKSLKILLVVFTLLLIGAAHVPTKNILGRGGDIVFLFSAGSALYRIRCVMKNPPAILIQNFGAILVAAFIFFTGTVSNLTLFMGFAALIFGLSFQRGTLSQILSTKFFIAAGLASYSLYMTHAIVGQAYGLYTSGLPPQPLVIRVGLFALLLLSLGGAAIAFHRFIEEPANRALRRMFNKPKTPTIPAGASLAT